MPSPSLLQGDSGVPRGRGAGRGPGTAAAPPREGLGGERRGRSPRGGGEGSLGSQTRGSPGLLPAPQPTGKGRHCDVTAATRWGAERQGRRCDVSAVAGAGSEPRRAGAVTSER